MKKFFLMIAATMMAASVSAQNTAITSNKAGDNWYFGINAGVSTLPKESYKDAGNGFFKSIAPTFGVRLGKNLTTVFGLAADADLYFKCNDKFYAGSKTFINALDLNLLGTFNLSNLFAGYPGEPRAFELIALGGFGWEHDFNHLPKTNGLNSKIALDFTFNLGAAKAWQLYIEPALTYNLHAWSNGIDMSAVEAIAGINDPGFQYDINRSLFSLKAGLNYKFGNSNGTHNFVKAQLRDQAEIDGLNAKINELRADVNAKDGKIAADAQTIADLKAKLAACEARPTATVVEKKVETLQPIVIFRQGKSTIEPAQYASIEMIAKYMKNHPESIVKVQGYASPEGNAELNQKLSEKRADAVKNALIKKYKIAANRITTEGLGATDKLSDEIDFNRVAMFIDTTKQ
ncbi:MAG: OmpA family protein [Prevotella sp.]|nr:OmpA family protein [Prevotella sp.]